MKISSTTKFITTYPERIVFFICLIMLLVVFLIYQFGSKEDLTIISVRKDLDELRQIIEKNKPKTLPEIDYFKKIKTIWENITSGIEGKSWLMYRQPVEAVKFEKIIERPQNLKANLPPIIKSVQNEKEPNKVTLNWDKNKDSTVKVKSYRIYRSSQQEKDFSLIAETTSISPTDNGYSYLDDKELKAETEYFYYITVFSDEPNVNRQESEPSNKVNIITSKDYIIEFRSVENDLVYTKITKYLNGQWDNQSYNIKKGDNIGKDNFSTGCILLDIQPYEITKNVAGNPTKIKTFKIVYIDKTKEYSFIIEPK